MKIVIVANFTHNFDLGIIDGRFTTIAELLASKGHEVLLLTSQFDHDSKDYRKPVLSSSYKSQIVYLYEPAYSRNVSIKRLYAHYTWGVNVLKYIKKINYIDCVYCAIPSITAAHKLAKYSQKHGIKFVVDLQDLWPEAFAMAIKNSFLQKFFIPMKRYVDFAYSSADLAIGVSETYVNRILEVNSKLDRGLSVFLGNNGGEFEIGCNKYHLDRTNKEFVVGYVGNMSTSYDIPLIFDALAKVKERGCVALPIRFILIGGGVDEQKFKAYGQQTYPNHTFYGRKSYREMAGMISDCDIVVNPIVKGSVASIINKVGDYALSGVPVINTQESEEYRNLVDSYNCGINCRCGNVEDVSYAIEKLLNDLELRKTMSEGQIRLGKDKFDRRYTYPQIVKAVEILLK